MNTPQLPAELIVAILAHISPSPSSLATLHALSLTSLHFNTITTPLLYHTMTLPNPSAHFAFLTTLRTQPHLAPLVRVYHLPSQVQKLVIMAYTVREELWKALRLALKAMVNLKELIIPKDLPMSSAYKFLPVITSFPPPFGLDKLVWLTYSSASAFRWDTESGKGAVQSVLDAQPNLTYLRWGSPIFPSGVIFPRNLTCLGGTTQFLIHVLPHAPRVRHVNWNTMHTQSELVSISPLPVQIQRLMELEGFRRLHTLRISGGLENRALYEMYKLAGQRRKGGGVDVDVAVEVLVLSRYYPLRDPSLLACFPHLSELIIITEPQTSFITTASTTNAEPIPPPPNTPLTTLNAWVDDVFKRHCGLLSVDVRVEDDGSDCYRRWVKGESVDGYFLLGKELLLD